MAIITVIVLRVGVWAVMMAHHWWAVDDSAGTLEDTPITINLVANDIQSEGDPLFVHSVTGPAVISGTTSVTYTPYLNFNGEDEFTYTVSDGRLASIATVSITVAAVNDVPFAFDDIHRTNEETAIQIDLIENDIDVDGDVLLIDGLTQPANGTVNISGTTVVTYTPHVGYIGNDTFTYTVSDGVLTDTATVMVAVGAWYPLDSGVLGSPRALALNGADLYVGGYFTRIANCEGGVDEACSRVARWDGSSWRPLHMGIDNGRVESLVHNGSDLYAGGAFSSVSGCMGGDSLCAGIARWDGSDWHPLGGGIDIGGTGAILDLISDGTDLYVGGFFASIAGCIGGDTLCQNIARWDGSNWYPINNGVDHFVTSLAVQGSDLYIGGGFQTISSCVGGAERCRSIARWDGSNWHPINNGVGGSVASLAVHGSDVYVGGGFLSIPGCVGGDTLCEHIARWDGANWHPMGIGSHVSIEDIEPVGNALYVAGLLYRIPGCVGGDSLCQGVVRWDGSDWHPVHLGISYAVSTILRDGTDLYVGGTFQQIEGCQGGDSNCNYIARWRLGDDANPSLVAVGDSAGTPEDTPININLVANDVHSEGAPLFVDSVTQPANGTVVISGTTGVAYTPTVNFNGEDIFTYIVSDGVLTDTAMVTVTVSNWHPLGNGILSSAIFALATIGTDTYAGGSFSSIPDCAGDDNLCQGVARWDGHNWHPLNSGDKRHLV